MRRKISWDGQTDGRTDRGKTVYPTPPPRSGGIISINWSGISSGLGNLFGFHRNSVLSGFTVYHNLHKRWTFLIDFYTLIYKYL